MAPKKYTVRTLQTLLLIQKYFFAMGFPVSVFTMVSNSFIRLIYLLNPNLNEGFIIHIFLVRLLRNRCTAPKLGFLSPLESFLRCKESINPVIFSCSLTLMKARNQIFIMASRKMGNIPITSCREFGLKAR